MANEHSEAMKASKVRLRKLQETPYVEFGQNDEMRGIRELGLAIEAVPCGGLGEILFNKLIKQRKEILQFLESAGYAIEEIASTKKRKPISFHIKNQDVEGDARSRPRRLRANVQDVYIVLSDTALSDAAFANKEAIEEICEGHIERSIEHYVRAERSIGAALALAQMDKVTSTIATAKVTSRHRKTYALRDRVIDYWRKECDPEIPAEKVAGKIERKFPWKTDKRVSRRTLVKWISAEKRKVALRK